MFSKYAFKSGIDLKTISIHWQHQEKNILIIFYIAENCSTPLSTGSKSNNSGIRRKAKLPQKSVLNPSDRNKNCSTWKFQFFIQKRDNSSWEVFSIPRLYNDVLLMNSFLDRPGILLSWFLRSRSNFSDVTDVRYWVERSRSSHLGINWIFLHSRIERGGKWK